MGVIITAMRLLIGTILKQIREEMGLSQGRLSELSGVSQSAINKIEHGTIPRIDTLVDLTSVLKTTPNDVLRKAGMLPGSTEVEESEAIYLYQIARKLNDDEKKRVSEYALWRLAEQKQKYELNQIPDEGGQDDGTDAS